MTTQLWNMNIQAEKLSIIVFNKIDQYDPNPTHEDIFEDKTIYDLELLKKSWMAKVNSPVVFISALNSTNMDELRLRIIEALKGV